MVNRWSKNEQFFDSLKIGKSYENAEKFNLAKFGYTEDRNDDEIFSYLRGYVWRIFRIRIKQPIDEVLFWLIELALEANRKLEKEKPNKIRYKKKHN